ncbi:unnamed protein product [Brassicogethes aeneus]|uniref:Xylulose kinase n=1 Tax=Brassicogethes aeneus TaxID=1431903 RepID=A0A9P0FGN1_BRAAE|nr:unnamed protein product [Brassicogethes aeneus]
MEDRSFLGLDLSTQQLKAVVVNDNLEIIHQASVHFDSDLPEFRTQGGVVIDKTSPRCITAPTIMFVKALDMLMDRLTVTGVDFSKIAAVSGSAQQHGSVYWQKGAEKILSNLNPSEFLHLQLATSFAINQSPVWMDSSTTKQCQHFEKLVGGPQKLAEITGSRAYERFTGTQIAKLAISKPDAFKITERISLISSFLTSLFLGKIAPIDISDGSGMNLLNINTKKWEKVLLEACGPNAIDKLGEEVVPSNTNLGKISNYYVERYGFSPECRIITGTGDNPASLMGMRLQDDCVAVSLGTSDTVILWLNEPKVVLDGHILCNPVNPEAYMALLCFKNGSRTRERIRDKCAEGSWDIFNQLLDSTPRGNFGNMALYYDVQEILPFLQGDHRYNKSGPVNKFTSLEVEVRALVEGQFIAKRAYAEDFGFKVGKNTKILATGGASNNKSILQVLADVFNAPVYVQEASDSAMLGAAYQAKHGLLQDSSTFTEITACLPPSELACAPFSDAADIYEPMLERYRMIIKNLVPTEIQ